MKHGSLLIVGAVTGLALLSLFAQRQRSLPTHGLIVLTASGAAQDSIPDPEVAAAKATAQQYRGLTEQAIRTKYQALRETTQESGVLDIEATDGRTGDKVRFSFDKGALYQVVLKGTNGGGYHIYLNGDGSFEGYSDRSKSIACYTNGQLRSIEHYGPYPFWLGPVRFYSETGELLVSTNYSKPTTPEFPEKLRWGHSTPITTP
jgi:hypothetical protein